MNTKQTPDTLELGGYRWVRTNNKPFGMFFNSVGDILADAMPYLDAEYLLTPRHGRPVEASPLPGDEEVARAITEELFGDSGLTVDEKQETVGYLSTILARHREQATAPLREAFLDFAKIAQESKPNCGPKLKAMIQEAQEKHSATYQAARFPAHPTKAEPPRVVDTNPTAEEFASILSAEHGKDATKAESLEVEHVQKTGETIHDLSDVSKNPQNLYTSHPTSKASAAAVECAARVRNAIDNATGYEADIIQQAIDAAVAGAMKSIPRSREAQAQTAALQETVRAYDWLGEALKNAATNFQMENTSTAYGTLKRAVQLWDGRPKKEPSTNESPTP